MNSMQLKLQFKGNRNYLHGSDIYNETLTWLKFHRGDVQSIDFSFHRTASNHLSVIVGISPEAIDPVAICSFTTKGVRDQLYIVESEHAVTGRYQYPEEEIVSQMEIDLKTKRCFLRGDIAYSDIEVWLAMAKELHYKLYPLLSGKWFFVRCRHQRYELFSKKLERTLCVVANFNNKLTRSEVFLEDQKVGEIFFAVV